SIFFILPKNKIRPAFLPHSPAGRETESRRISKIFSLGFANPPSRKIASQNRVHFPERLIS
ncbi:MAG: hypothetical protein AAB614_03510, partial [Patescibacteria group bacterium]